MISSAPIPDEAAPLAGRTLLYRVGATVYGSDIGDVREVLPYRSATRLPGAPAYVRGLINLRGTIVTVVDLGARLDAARAPATSGSILVASVGTRLTGVVVDEVMDVRPVEMDEAQESGGSSDGVVRGLGHSGDQVVILIDIHSLVKQVLL